MYVCVIEYNVFKTNLIIFSFFSQIPTLPFSSSFIFFRYSLTPKERPYTCSYCGKSFTQSNTLKQHTRIHTGEKPFRCGYCGRAFTVKDYLNKHLTTHTGERIYYFAIKWKLRYIIQSVNQYQSQSQSININKSQFQSQIKNYQNYPCCSLMLSLGILEHSKFKMQPIYNFCTNLVYIFCNAKN